VRFHDHRQHTVSESGATSPHRITYTDTSPQLSGTQPHSPARGRMADPRSRRRAQPNLRSTIRCLRRASLRDSSKAGSGYWWVTRGVGIPSRRRQRCSRSGWGVQIVQRMRCSIWMPHPDLLQGKLADATGYPLPVLRHANTLTTTSTNNLGSCPSCARTHGDSRATTGNDGHNLTDRAPERFSAHTELPTTPFHGGTPMRLTGSERHRKPVKIRPSPGRER